jgi:excisionase family DNA binding protein
MSNAPDVRQRASAALARQERRSLVDLRKAKVAKRAATAQAAGARLAYSVSEVAVLLGRDQATIHRWMNSGLIKSTKIAGIRLITRAELDRLLGGDQP